MSGVSICIFFINANIMQLMPCRYHGFVGPSGILCLNPNWVPLADGPTWDKDCRPTRDFVVKFVFMGYARVAPLYQYDYCDPIVYRGI
jgi:hypothetical protein